MLASVTNDYSYTLKLSAAFPSLVHLVIMQTISLVGQGDDGPDIPLIKSHFLYILRMQPKRLRVQVCPKNQLSCVSDILRL